MARCYYERLFIGHSSETESTGLVSLSRQNYFLKLRYFLEDSDSPKVLAVRRRMICEIDVDSLEDEETHSSKRIKSEHVEINENEKSETVYSDSVDKEKQGNDRPKLVKGPETDPKDTENKKNDRPRLEPVEINENEGPETDHTDPKETENQENDRPKIKLVKNRNDLDPKMNQFTSSKPVIQRIIPNKRQTIYKKRPSAAIENSNSTNTLENSNEKIPKNPIIKVEHTENSNDKFYQIESDIGCDLNDQSPSDTDTEDNNSDHNSNVNIETTDSNSNSNDTTCSTAFKCDQCEYECNKRSLLTKHMMKHATTKRHQCGECEYTTNSLYHLKRHKLQHSDIKGFKCPDCDFITMKLSEIKSHQISEHTQGILQEAGMYKCAFCGYAHKHLSKLVEHMAKHTGCFKFNCEQCSYSTNQKKHLDRHMSAHKSEYKCMDCPYTTTQKDDYKAHRNAHLIKGFTCDKCDFKSMRSDVMNHHKLQHADLTLFNCEECDYGTNYSSHIRRHMAMHERERLKPKKTPKPPKTPKSKAVKQKKAKVLLSDNKQEEYDELMSKIQAIDNLLNEDEKSP